MNKEHVLSHAVFDWIDFSESFVSRYEKRDDAFVLVVWGCTLLQDSNPELRQIISRNDIDEDVYVAGYSEFFFRGLCSYSVATVLYEGTWIGSPFQKDSQGKHVRIFETETVDHHPNGTVHELNGVNLKPYGYSTVKITNSGPIHFILNNDDCISVTSFVRHPRDYIPPFLR